MNTLHREITNQIVTDFYDQPIMSNLSRPHYIERMIILGLGDEWKLVSANWSGWDIESRDGIKVEVKQSAARQVWTDRPSLAGRTTKGQFDIAPRTGYLGGRRKSVDRDAWASCRYLYLRLAPG